jgi:hypothetical protein
MQSRILRVFSVILLVALALAGCRAFPISSVVIPVADFTPARVMSPSTLPPQHSIPLVDIGPQPPDVCVVVPNAEQANIYAADASNGPTATLVGTVRFVRQADNAYIVELPPGGLHYWVSAVETHLVGDSCPE